MERLTRVFAETTHGTKGYESVNEIKVDTESIHNLSEIITTLGKMEDVLEEFELTSAEDLRNYLNFQDNMGTIWESKLDLKNKIAELEQELAELKQNAIVPKFKVGQEIWEITPLMSWKIKRIEWHKFNGGYGEVVMEIYRLGHDGTDNYNCCIMPVDSDRFFATKEEAEQKLAEIKGEKNE